MRAGLVLVGGKNQAGKTQKNQSHGRVVMGVFQWGGE